MEILMNHYLAILLSSTCDTALGQLRGLSYIDWFSVAQDVSIATTPTCRAVLVSSAITVFHT